MTEHEKLQWTILHSIWIFNRKRPDIFNYMRESDFTGECLTTFKLMRDGHNTGIIDDAGYSYEILSRIPDAAVQDVKHKAWKSEANELIRGNLNARINSASAMASHLASDTSMPPVEKAIKVQDIFKDLVDSRLLEAKTIREQVSDTEKVIADARKGDIQTVDWGLEFVNQQHRMLKGGLYILAARPAHGKTAFAVTCINHQLAKGMKVAIFCGEMRSTDLVIRLSQQFSGMTFMEVVGGMPRASELAILDHKKGMDILRNSSLFMQAGKSVTVEEIRHWATDNHKEHQLDAIWIDYIQRVRPTPRSGTNRRDQVAHIARELKQLALDLEIPVIALAQLNRETVGTVPQLKHLAESSVIEQEADGVFLLDRPDTDRIAGAEYKRPYKTMGENGPINIGENMRGLAWINIAKARAGAAGAILAKFHDKTMTFSEPQPEDYQ